MKILVTGSEGTLGRPLVTELRARGHEVVGLDLAHAHRGYDYERADIGDHRELGVALQKHGPDYVYNLAAEFGRMNGEDFYARNWQTNCVGVRNILEWQRVLGFRLIHASSSEVYGELESDEPIREDVTETRCVLPANDYAISKWAGELQVRHFTARHGTEAMVLRFFNAYGPGERYTRYRSVVALFCHGALTGVGYTVYENYHRVFMYIDDFIPTLANACERFVPGETVNIGGTDYRSVEELDAMVRAFTSLPKSRVRYLTQDAHNVVSKRPDITKARELLGHDPQVRLELGVSKTVSWMKHGGDA